MSSFSSPRRLLSSIAVLAIAALGLTVIPASAANAYSASSSRGKLLAFVNHLRVHEGEPAWASNAFLDGYAQSLAQNAANCHGCTHPKSINYKPTPNQELYTKHLSAGSASARISKLEKLIPSQGSTPLDATFGAVGYAVDGSTAYFVLYGFAPQTIGNVPFASKAGTAAISGHNRVGRELTASAPTLTPAPDSVTYDWTAFREGGPANHVSTATTYVPVAADVGGEILVTVTLARSGYQPVVFEASVTPVALGEFSAPKLFLGGQRDVGSTLSATVSALPNPGSMTYTWLKGGHKISGETGSTYVIRHSDYGHKIDSQVKIALDGYRSVTLRTHTSTKTGHPVLPQPSVGPSITPLSPVVGGKETANPGSWVVGTPRRIHGRHGEQRSDDDSRLGDVTG